MKNTRKHIRWRKWDYSSSGAYFVTICTKNNEPFFGEIIQPPEVESQETELHIPLDSYLHPTHIGEIAWNNWLEIPAHYPFASLDAFVVMPNHIHGILHFEKKTEEAWTPLKKGPQRNNLPDVIRTYKGSVTRYANKNDIHFKWQGRYHDRVIRNLTELSQIRNYIWNNPSR